MEFTVLTSIFVVCFYIREVKTKSGASAIQVVQHLGHRSKIAKHIGSGNDEVEVSILRQKAKGWIEKHTSQTPLFPLQKHRFLVVELRMYQSYTSLCLAVLLVMYQ